MVRLDIEETKSRITTAVPRLLKKHSVPGAAVALFTNGEVVFTCRHGVRCAGKRDPIDQHTVFDGASLANLFSHMVLTNGQNGLRVCRPVVEAIFGNELAAFDNI